VLCSGLVQIAAPWTLQLITNPLPVKRRARALAGALFNFILFNALWIGGYFAMIRTKEALPEDERLDVYDSGYDAWAFLYVMYGFMDAVYKLLRILVYGSIEQ